MIEKGEMKMNTESCTGTEVVHRHEYTDWELR